jgi:hypothetical protein
VRGPNRLRKKVLAQVLDIIKQLEGHITDDFPTKVTDLYIGFLQDHRRLPSVQEWIRIASRVETRFYRENRRLTKIRTLTTIAEGLESGVSAARELKELLDSRNQVFIGHSNVFPNVYEHFVDVIRRAGYKAVVAEMTPNLGKNWHPGQKVASLMKRCGALVAVLTPDDPRTKLPRLNVIHEIGLAQGRQIPVLYLKAREAELPSNINPVYISFRLAHPEDADDELLNNLRSLTRSTTER